MDNLTEQYSNFEDPRQRDYVNSAVSRWETIGLLKGLAGRKKRVMATLLENQARDLHSKKLLNESTQTGTTTGYEGWSNVALPLVRKVFGNLLANEIVSVQPMNLPSGLVFYLDFKFGTTATRDKDQRTAGESLYGNTSSSGQPAGGYYGGVNYSYTRNFLSGNIGPLASGALIQNNTNTYYSAAWADVDYDATLSASIVTGAASQFKVVIIPLSSMSNVDETVARAITLTGAGTVAAVYRKFTKYDAANSAIKFIISGVHQNTADSANITASWIRKTTEGFRGDFEIGQTGVGPNPIPELNLEVKSKAVVAETRKLKAIWTPELQQDLAAYHDLDAEAELTSMLADQVSLEIDREIIDQLLLNGDATNPFFWSRNIGTFVDSTGATIAGTGTFYGTQQEWYQTLVETIIEVSNRIHKKTLRGAANFLIASPEVCTMFEATQQFRPVMTMDEKENKYSMGIEKIGNLSGRWTVYKDPYMIANKILIGYKGTTFLENGYVYSPYVPLVLTPTVMDPDVFTPRKGVMTRYARTVVRPEFYGSITVKDLRY